MSGHDAATAHLLAQARACDALGSPLYGRLLRGCADDLRGGGPVARALAGHLGAPQDDLSGCGCSAGCTPWSSTAGPRGSRGSTPAPAGAPTTTWCRPSWPRSPSTTTRSCPGWTGRPRPTSRAAPPPWSAACCGCSRGRDLPVVLHEVGASAGLNLLGDRYRHQLGPDGPWWGPASSPVAMADAWRGAAPDPAAPLRVVGRHGSDIAPVDLSRPGAAVRLQAWVWPDQTARLARLRAALGWPRRTRCPSRARCGRRRARRGPAGGAPHRVWHSVMWQYLPPAEQRAAEDALAALGARADEGTPLARLSLEPARPGQGEPGGFVVAATVWPGGKTRVLGRASPHGPPVGWLP